MAVRLLGSDLVGIFEGTTIGECCGDRVHEATVQDITLRDLIGRCCYDRISRLDIFEDALRKRHSFDFSQGDRLDLVVDIRDADGKGYDLIEVIFLIFMRLGYHVVRVNALIDNSQRTKHSGYHVVGQLCPFERSVGEDVLARSDKCLAAGYVIRETFAVRESVAAYRYLVIRKRRSIVFLLIARARQRYFAWLDRQLARLRIDRELLRYVVAIDVLHDRSAGHGCGVVAGVRSLRLRAQAFYRVRLAIHHKLQRLEAAYGFHGSIVFLRSAVGDHCDLILCLAVGHCQLSIHYVNLVVFGFRSLVQLIRKHIVAIAGDQLASRHFVRRAFAFHEAVSAYRHFVVRKRRSIVFLLSRRAR